MAMSHNEIPIRTADGHPITDGMAVWTNDLEIAYVALATAQPESNGDLWFVVVNDPDELAKTNPRGHLMNGERCAVRHPFTGQIAS